MCRHKGSDLAILKTTDDFAEAYKYCVNHHGFPCFIGLHSPSCEYNFDEAKWIDTTWDWRWIDGTPLINQSSNVN